MKVKTIIISVVSISASSLLEQVVGRRATTTEAKTRVRLPVRLNENFEIDICSFPLTFSIEREIVKSFTLKWKNQTV